MYITFTIDERLIQYHNNLNSPDEIDEYNTIDKLTQH